MATILIIEDDPTTAYIQTALLGKLGLGVLVVQEGQDAIHVMKDIKPDVVVLDLILTSRSGTEILSDMARHPELKDIPIVAYSANVDPQDKVFHDYRKTYQALRQAEPLVVNKIPKPREIRQELPRAIATLLEEAGISLPPELISWKNSNPSP